MKKVTELLERYLMPIGAKLAANKALNAVRDGIAYAMPLVIVGSLTMLIANGFSIDAFKTWLIDNGSFDWLVKITNGTFGLMGVVAVFGIAYRYAQELKVDGVSSGIIALSGYVISTPTIMAKAGEGFPLTYMGASGLFAAILIALVSTKIFAWFMKKDIRIKMPDGVPPAVANSFAALIPGAVIVLLWGGNLCRLGCNANGINSWYPAISFGWTIVSVRWLIGRCDCCVNHYIAVLVYRGARW